MCSFTCSFTEARQKTCLPWRTVAIKLLYYLFVHNNLIILIKTLVVTYFLDRFTFCLAEDNLDWLQPDRNGGFIVPSLQRWFPKPNFAQTTYFYWHQYNRITLAIINDTGLSSHSLTWVLNTNNLKHSLPSRPLWKSSLTSFITLLTASITAYDVTAVKFLPISLWEYGLKSICSSLAHEILGKDCVAEPSVMATLASYCFKWSPAALPDTN